MINGKISEYISRPEINLFVSVMIPLLGLAVLWGVQTTRMDRLEKMVDSLQTTYTQQQFTNQGIQIKLAELQKDVSYIRLEIEKLGK